jgi:hypothetical protein
LSADSSRAREVAQRERAGRGRFSKGCGYGAYDERYRSIALDGPDCLNYLKPYGPAIAVESKLSYGKVWLGDLDSNQDSQIQSLESYQLDDLPAVEKKWFSGSYLAARAVFSLTIHPWTSDLF